MEIKVFEVKGSNQKKSNLEFMPGSSSVYGNWYK